MLRIDKELLERLKILVLHLSHLWRFHGSGEEVEGLAIFVSSCKDTILTKLSRHPGLNTMLGKLRQLECCHMIHAREIGLVDSCLHVLCNTCIAEHPRSYPFCQFLLLKFFEEAFTLSFRFEIISLLFFRRLVLNFFLIVIQFFLTMLQSLLISLETMTRVLFLLLLLVDCIIL